MKYFRNEFFDYFIYYTKGNNRLATFRVFGSQETIPNNFTLAIKERIPLGADRNQIFNWIRFKLRGSDIPIWNY